MGVTKRYLLLVLLIGLAWAVPSVGTAETEIFCDYEDGQFKNILVDGSFSEGKNACLTLKVKDLGSDEIVLTDDHFTQYSIRLSLGASQKQEIKDWSTVMSCRYYFRIDKLKGRKISGNLITILECN